MSTKKIIGFVTLAIIVGIAAYFINGKMAEKKTDWYKSSRLINLPIPEDTKVLRSSDTHGGFHGDGEYFVVFQFTESQYENFIANLYQSNRWIDLPLGNDLDKFIFGERKGSQKFEGHGENKIPRLTRNGRYYFSDLFVEKYPQYKSRSILDRPSNNFIFGLLDIENRKLYIMKYDS